MGLPDTVSELAVRKPKGVSFAEPGTSSALLGAGQKASKHERKVMAVLERRVLNEHTAELREYFTLVCRQMHSLTAADGAGGGEEALSTTTGQSW